MKALRQIVLFTMALILMLVTLNIDLGINLVVSANDNVLTENQSVVRPAAAVGISLTAQGNSPGSWNGASIASSRSAKKRYQPRISVTKTNAAPASCIRPASWVLPSALYQKAAVKKLKTNGRGNRIPTKTRFVLMAQIRYMKVSTPIQRRNQPI